MNLNIEMLRDYCLSRKGVTEGFPFGETVLVFKVAGKMFALMSLEQPCTMNLKCNPGRAVELREQYPDIRSGYHMNKKHWNTIVVGANLSSALILRMIDDSYDLVVAGLSKKEKEQLNA